MKKQEANLFLKFTKGGDKLGLSACSWADNNCLDGSQTPMIRDISGSIRKFTQQKNSHRFQSTKHHNLLSNIEAL